MWILQKKFVEKYTTDALVHFGYGGWITSFGLPFGFTATLFVFAIMILLALFKEFFLDDGFDWIDFNWSVYGGLVTVIFSLIVYTL